MGFDWIVAHSDNAPDLSCPTGQVPFVHNPATSPLLLFSSSFSSPLPLLFFFFIPSQIKSSHCSFAALLPSRVNRSSNYSAQLIPCSPLLWLLSPASYDCELPITVRICSPPPFTFQTCFRIVHCCSLKCSILAKLFLYTNTDHLIIVKAIPKLQPNRFILLSS